MLRSVLLAIMVGLLAAPAVADDAAKANRLMVEAVGYIRESKLASAADRRFELLKMAHDRLAAIVKRHPSTDLAVRLATGQQVGSVSLESVRSAMNEAMKKAMESMRTVDTREPGAPLRAWRLKAGVVALALPAGKSWAWMVDRDGVAILRDIETGRELRRWGGRLSAVAAALSPRGNRVLTAFETNAVVLRDTRTLKMLRGWEHNGPIPSVALSRDESGALVGLQELPRGSADLVDVIALKPRHVWRHRAPPTAVAWSPDGRLVLVGFADGSAFLGETARGRTLHRWRHPGSGSGGVASAAFSADGGRVLVGTANRQAVLRDTRSGRTLRAWDAGNKITSVALSRDGRWALTGDEDWEVELHDARTGRTVRKWRYESWPTAIAFSHDGRQAFMGFGDGAAIICDIRIPQKRRRFIRTYLSLGEGCW